MTGLYKLSNIESYWNIDVESQFFFQFNEPLVLFDGSKLNAFSEYLHITLILIVKAPIGTPN